MDRQELGIEAAALAAGVGPQFRLVERSARSEKTRRDSADNGNPHSDSLLYAFFFFLRDDIREDRVADRIVQVLHISLRREHLTEIPPGVPLDGLQVLDVFPGLISRPGAEPHGAQGQSTSYGN